MSAKKTKGHPHHFDGDKHLYHRFFDIAVPLGLLTLFYVFYNKGAINPSEAVKTTGLLAISLLAITLIVGPLSRIFSFFEAFKANRKVWGVLSFWAAASHMLLVVHFFWHWNLGRFVDFGNPRYLTTATGALGLVILAIVTLTSSEKMIKALTPNTWKLIQTTSYLALASSLTHFYIVTFKAGSFAFRNGFSQFTFYFCLLVIIARIAIIFLPSKKK